jgi:cytochrome c556
MRVALLAIPLVLTACGGPEASQANNGQANISDSASPPATANAMVLLVTTHVSGKAAAIMHERHEGMETIGKANKALHHEVDGASPDLAVVRASAAKIAALSMKASGWFPEGTGPEVAKTGAKPEIWQDPDDFAAKLAAFQKAALVFNSIAAHGDGNAVKAAWPALGKTCKACHDKYRTEMHH